MGFLCAGDRYETRIAYGSDGQRYRYRWVVEAQPVQRRITGNGSQR